jgi:hypothetical protein
MIERLPIIRAQVDRSFCSVRSLAPARLLGVAQLFMGPSSWLPHAKLSAWLVHQPARPPFTQRRSHPEQRKALQCRLL